MSAELSLNNYGRALFLTFLGVAAALLELVIFSWLAHFFGVRVNIGTMEINWLVAFFCLLIIPAVFFGLAFMTLFGQTTVPPTH